MKFEDMLDNIVLGDSYELIKGIPDNSIDLVVIDPPYEYVTGGKNNFISKRPYNEEMYKVAKKLIDKMMTKLKIEKK